MAKKLICVGACYLDTIISVPHFPEEDFKLRANDLKVRRGGNCPNTLEVLQQLLRHREVQLRVRRGRDRYDNNGDDDDFIVQPYLITTLPSADSPATRRIADSFAAKGGDGSSHDQSEGGSGSITTTDISYSICRADHTEPASCYALRSQATGSRTLVSYNALPDMTVDEFIAAAEGLMSVSLPHEKGKTEKNQTTTTVLEGDKDDQTGGSAWWHFEGRIPETTLRCIRHVRKVYPASKISVELERPGRAGLEALAAEADVVFYSRAWAEAKGYESSEQCVQAQVDVAAKASYLCCTWGSRGASSMCRASRDIVSCPAVAPGESCRVVDTVGAGDTFIAGILYGMLCHPDDDWDLPRRVRFAVRLATSKVQREGFDGVGAEAMTRI